MLPYCAYTALEINEIGDLRRLTALLFADSAFVSGDCPYEQTRIGPSLFSSEFLYLPALDGSGRKYFFRPAKAKQTFLSASAAFRKYRLPKNDGVSVSLPYVCRKSRQTAFFRMKTHA